MIDNADYVYSTSSVKKNNLTPHLVARFLTECGTRWGVFVFYIYFMILCYSYSVFANAPNAVL